MNNTTDNEDTSRGMQEYILPASILISVLILSGAWMYTAGLKSNNGTGANDARQNGAPSADAASETITPSAGITLPVRWGDLGKRMAAAGVIDEPQFRALYAQRGGLPPDVESLLGSSDNENLVITPQNAGTILNLLWAFGLGNKNTILETGPMVSTEYGGDPGRFASTGGWTLAQGDPMGHYGKHAFITLTKEQQELVERVSKNVYRPCCNNATYFPDCNHGMAMLGLLELMASQGATESQMYAAALAVNSYWFPDAYRTIAAYLESQGTRWAAVDPREVLGAAYSSAQGYARIQSLAAPQPAPRSRGGCGV